MLEIAISLLFGFALGYGVREWAFADHTEPHHNRPSQVLERRVAKLMRELPQEPKPTGLACAPTGPRKWRAKK